MITDRTELVDALRALVKNVYSDCIGADYLIDRADYYETRYEDQIQALADSILNSLPYPSEPMGSSGRYETIRYIK